jgi:hypothetical protein
MATRAAALESWSEALLDGASFRLADHAARAAGIGIEEWLERAIRRACSGPGEITVLPPGLGAQAGITIDQAPARRSLRGLLLALVPAVMIAGFAVLGAPAGGGLTLELPRAQSIALAMPQPTAPRPQPQQASPDAEPSDPVRLALWLEPRARAGDAVAEYRLGTLYALGKGVEKDYARAAPLLRAAAEKGLAEAQYDYAVLCENGFGVAKDTAQAVEWYRKSAAQGNPDALLSLGYAYAKGIGVPRNMGEAAQWFRRAAELGVVDAQYNLAFLYEHGEGVAKSPVEAYAWYAIAGARGDPGSQQSADRVARDLSAEQFKEAVARMTALQRLVKSER